MIRVLWRHDGLHVHMRVFIGAAPNGALAGTLCVRADEFLMLREGWPGALFLKADAP